MILPPDVYWPLRVKADASKPMAFELWVWYHWQFLAGRKDIVS